MNSPFDLPLRPGVTNQTLEKNGITVDRAITGHSLVIPYFRPFDGPAGRQPVKDQGHFFRKRWLHAGLGDAKYTQQQGTIPHAYFPLGAVQLASEHGRLIVTEGEFKALSLMEAGFPAGAIGGIYSFALGGELVPELAEFFKAFSTIRKVYFLGDADTALIPSFASAAVRFCGLIAEASPDTRFFLPRMALEDVQSRKGIDDARAAMGNEEFGPYFAELLNTGIVVTPKTCKSDLAFELFDREREGLARLLDQVDRNERDTISRKLFRLANACGPVKAGFIAKVAVSMGLAASATDFKAEQRRRAHEDIQEIGEAVPKVPVKIHYLPRGNKNYYYRAGADHYTSVDRRGAVNRLIEAGYSNTREGDRRLAETDQVVTLSEKHPLDWAGSVAGRKAGVQEIGGRKILVTTSPKLVKPEEGTWETIQRFIEDRLDYECAAPASIEQQPPIRVCQSPIFLGWLSLAVRDLYLHGGRFTPAQALVLCGPKRVGKNVIQDVITAVLGGRCEAPFGFMEGRTSFNGNLIGAEHWMIADEQAGKRHADRERLKSFLKQFCVNRFQSFNAKFAEALNLDPFRRLSISLNDDAESLKVLPSLTENFADKLILLRVFRKQFFGEGTPFATFQEFWDHVISELPAFVHALQGYEIPDAIMDPDYGVNSYHNVQVVGELDKSAPETEFSNVVAHYVLTGEQSLWRGTASELIALLAERNCPQLSQIESYNSTYHVGRYLAALTRKRPEMFGDGGVVNGYATYEIRSWSEAIMQTLSPLGMP